MNILVALLVVLVAANVAAQHLAWPYGATLLPAGAVAPVVAVKEPSTVLVKSLVENPMHMKGLFGVPVSSIYQYPHVVQVAIPSQDTTRGMPQPVEDTPEVKNAKALFAKEYEKAAIAAALAPEMRKRRDISSIMMKEVPASTTHLRSPMQYPWPLVTFSADHSWVSGHQVPSHFAQTPGVYGVPPVPVITY